MRKSITKNRIKKQSYPQTHKSIRTVIDNSARSVICDDYIPKFLSKKQKKLNHPLINGLQLLANRCPIMVLLNILPGIHAQLLL